MNHLYNLLIILIFTINNTTLIAQSLFQKQLDSLLLVLDKTTEGNDRVDILNEISYNYRRIEPQKVIEYGRKARKLAIVNNYTKGEAIAYKNMGIGYYKSSAPKDTTIGFYKKAIEKAKVVNDYYTQVACMNNIALVYNENLEFYKGIQFLLEAIKLYDEHYEKENRLKALMVANVGFAYFKLKQYQKALTYLERALNISADNNIPSIRSIYLDDLALTLIGLNRLEEANEVLDEALTVQTRQGDMQSVMQTLLHKMTLAIKRKRYNEAIGYANQLINKEQVQNFPSLHMVVFNKLAKIAFYKGNYQQTINHSQKAQKIAQNLGLLTYQKENLEYVHQAYEKLGMYAEAYKVSQQFILLMDSLQSSEKEKYTADLEAKYQNQEQARAIELLNERQNNQAIRMRLLIGITLITLIAIGLVTFLYLKRKQYSDIIEAKNQKLNEYIGYNMELENFAYITSHDLKTPLRTIVSFTQLLKRKITAKLDATELEYLDFIINGSKEMSTLVDDLLTYAQIQGQSIQIDAIEPKVLVEDTLRGMQADINKKNAEITIDIQRKWIRGDATKLKQLFQNLISNALKFHKPDTVPVVNIALAEATKYWIFSVKDNGIGIEKDYFDRIFLIFKRLHGKRKYDGTGIGLAICKKIADQHNGQIWVESEVGQGSTFFVSIHKNL